MEIIVAAISIIATLLGVVFAFHKVTSNTTKSLSESIDKSIDGFKVHLDTSLKEQRAEVKEDLRALDDKFEKRFDQLNSRMDTSSTELKELLYRETSALKLKDSEQDSTINVLKDRITHINEEHLKFKLTVAEQYERKKPHTH